MGCFYSKEKITQIKINNNLQPGSDKNKNSGHDRAYVGKVKLPKSYTIY